MSALREARTARGLRLQDLSEATGIDITCLSRLERGQKRLTVKDLHAIAKVIGLDELASAIAPNRQEAAT